MSLVLGLGLGLRLAAGNSLGPALVLLLGYFARSSLEAKISRKLLGAENGGFFYKKKSQCLKRERERESVCVLVFVC